MVVITNLNGDLRKKQRASCPEINLRALNPHTKFTSTKLTRKGLWGAQARHTFKNSAPILREQESRVQTKVSRRTPPCATRVQIGSAWIQQSGTRSTQLKGDQLDGQVRCQGKGTQVQSFLEGNLHDTSQKGGGPCRFVRRREVNRLLRSF